MRKNGSRYISIKQYRLTDLFLFAVILAIFDLLVFFAPRLFNKADAVFTFSLTVTITLIVMIRWGWPSVFFAVGDGLFNCLLNFFGTENFDNTLFAVYIIGNAFIMIMLLVTKFMGKEKIAGEWYFSALFVVLGWLSVYIGRCIVGVCFKKPIIDMLTGQLWDLLSLAMGVVIILVMRRLDGMFEDQRHYIRRLDEERKERKRRDTFGDEPVEIDEESLSILRKDDDRY